MERRDFLKTSMLAGVIAGVGLPNLSAAAENAAASGAADIIAVKGGEPEEMYSKGIAALGGMGAFVKSGQTVVVKPNIGWDKPPEMAANTNPKLVKAIVEDCFKAGASKVYVFDHTCNDWRNCYEHSGIAAAAKEAGATMMPGNSRNNYKEVEIPHGRRLKKDLVHELILESDVFINVPVLKVHGGAAMTSAMKNLMGVNWDRGYWHKNDLGQCIADFITRIRPTLNIVDAYRIMIAHGPQGVSPDDVRLVKYQLLSTDIVGIDALAAKILGKSPESISHLRCAAAMKLGKIDPAQLPIKRLNIGPGGAA